VGAGWRRISDANGRLRAIYDDFVQEIARRYPGGSPLDVACNNGYFPVRAKTLGMGRATGADLDWHYWLSIRFLNDVLGASVHFRRAVCRPERRRGPLRRRHDVVVASAILCHLPDPLEFLASPSWLAPGDLLSRSDGGRRRAAYFRSTAASVVAPGAAVPARLQREYAPCRAACSSAR
jgi:2-polyprenyl-3-methyl-5-hydroxy-6-metoxy-1,4-benzoquinol methylase